MQGGVAAQLRPSPADLEKGLRLRKLSYYRQCELLVYQQHKTPSGSIRAGRGKSRLKKGQAESQSDDDDADESTKQDAASVFLQLQ